MIDCRKNTKVICVCNTALYTGILLDGFLVNLWIKCRVFFVIFLLIQLNLCVHFPTHTKKGEEAKNRPPRAIYKSSLFMMVINIAT